VVRLDGRAGLLIHPLDPFRNLFSAVSVHYPILALKI
jgi:hypothetical protein